MNTILNFKYEGFTDYSSIYNDVNLAINRRGNFEINHADCTGDENRKRRARNRRCNRRSYKNFFFIDSETNFSDRKDLTNYLEAKAQTAYFKSHPELNP